MSDTSTPTEDTTEAVEVDTVPVFDASTDVPSTKPKYLVVGNTFIVQTERGEIKVPLFFQTKKIRTMPDGLQLLDQVYFLLGEESEVCKALDELEILDSREFASKLFVAYTQKERARLGK